MGLREIQAGQRGFGRSMARAGLSVLSGGFAVGTSLRRAAYGVKLRRPQRLDVPVVSVGNLAVGGTGKTPFVAWLATRLLEAGRRPGILARGYGADVVHAGEPGGPLNDEGAVLRHVLGKAVPQRQDPDRARGGRELLARHPGTDVLVLDDGFQHWALARDLDIVLLDATCPFGYGRLLPRGRLREKPAALARAGAVVLTRIDALDDAARQRLIARVGVHTDAPVAGAQTVATQVVTGGRGEAPSVLRGTPVYAVSGIGTPDAFRRTLEDLGAAVVGHRTFPDHHGGSRADWQRIEREAKEAGAARIVVTRKDAVKLRPLPDDLSVLDVETEVVFGAEALWRTVMAVFA